jgi:hypothetical protein
MSGRILKAVAPQVEPKEKAPTVHKGEGFSCFLSKGVLHIQVPIDQQRYQQAPLTSSQKAKLLASTKGFFSVECHTAPGLAISMNVTAKRPQ